MCNSVPEPNARKCCVGKVAWCSVCVHQMPRNWHGKKRCWSAKCTRTDRVDRTQGLYTERVRKLQSGETPHGQRKETHAPPGHHSRPAVGALLRISALLLSSQSKEMQITVQSIFVRVPPRRGASPSFFHFLLQSLATFFVAPPDMRDSKLFL